VSSTVRRCLKEALTSTTPYTDITDCEVLNIVQCSLLRSFLYGNNVLFLDIDVFSVLQYMGNYFLLFGCVFSAFAPIIPDPNISQGGIAALIWVVSIAMFIIPLVVTILLGKCVKMLFRCGMFCGIP